MVMMFMVMVVGDRGRGSDHGHCDYDDIVMDGT